MCQFQPKGFKFKKISNIQFLNIRSCGTCLIIALQKCVYWLELFLRRAMWSMGLLFNFVGVGLVLWVSWRGDGNVWGQLHIVSTDILLLVIVQLKGILWINIWLIFHTKYRGIEKRAILQNLGRNSLPGSIFIIQLFLNL